MSGSTLAATKRRHVTTACVACRESKVKCDGGSPTCSNCENKGKECLYRAGDDKRKLSIRLAIGLLSGRVEQLQQFIIDNSLSPPPMDKDQGATLKKVLENLRLNHTIPQNIIYEESPPCTAADHSNPGPTQPDAILDSQPVKISQACNEKDNIDHVSTSYSAQSWAWSELGEPPMFPMPALDGHQPAMADDILHADTPGSSNSYGAVAAPNYTTLEHSDSGIITDEAEALAEQLSDRMGSLQIGPGGQVRYYGPTSDFNLVEMPPSDNLTIHRTVRNDGQEYLERLGLDKEASDDLKSHLTNLYFCWQDPAIHVVNRKMYEEAEIMWREQRLDTQYYSEALQNAILALGAAFEARYHATFITYPKSLADFFADRAKALLEIELDSPSIATVQAMVVISGHDFGCKRDARGWLYSGMAIRLAFDLALHIDMTPFVEKGTLSQAEADVRRGVFWGAYTTDQMWGFHLGRPSRVNMQDVTVNKPEGLSQSKPAGRWTPYVSSNYLPRDVAPLQDDIDELSRHRAILWEIMAPIGYGLYGSMRTPTSQLREIIMTAATQLSSWKENLPPLLQIDLNHRQMHYLPHVMLLHMQFHQHIIYTYRPLMSKTMAQSESPQSPGFSHARMMCVDSAVAIAKLLQMYEFQYTLRHINVQAISYAGSAALILVFATVTNYDGGAGDGEVRLLLTTCLRALDEFGPSWESAKRVRDFLTILQRQWELQARSSRVRRAGSTSASSTQGVSPRKRPRTLSGLDQSPQDPRFQYHAPPHPQLEREFQAFGDPGNEMSLDFDWVFTGDCLGQARV
ncbi:fungal-specific transcription factor domain-containing protein [Xylariales sp. PMI_506]|nr:fungal-specific transcription factor domain-containing protein [Xylariales sp. PMI_506]